MLSTHCCQRWVVIPQVLDDSGPLQAKGRRPGSRAGLSSSQIPPPIRLARELEHRQKGRGHVHSQSLQPFFKNHLFKTCLLRMSRSKLYLRKHRN